MPSPTPTPTPIRLLHLSDIHFRVDRRWDADPILRHLAGRIGDDVAAGLVPDLFVAPCETSSIAADRQPGRVRGAADEHARLHLRASYDDADVSHTETGRGEGVAAASAAWDKCRGGGGQRTASRRTYAVRCRLPLPICSAPDLLSARQARAAGPWRRAEDG